MSSAMAASEPYLASHPLSPHYTSPERLDNDHDLSSSPTYSSHLHNNNSNNNGAANMIPSASRLLHSVSSVSLDRVSIKSNELRSSGNQPLLRGSFTTNEDVDLELYDIFHQASNTGPTMDGNSSPRFLFTNTLNADHLSSSTPTIPAFPNSQSPGPLHGAFSPSGDSPFMSIASHQASFSPSHPHHSSSSSSSSLPNLTNAYLQYPDVSPFSHPSLKASPAKPIPSASSSASVIQSNFKGPSTYQQSRKIKSEQLSPSSHNLSLSTEYPRLITFPLAAKQDPRNVHTNPQHSPFQSSIPLQPFSEKKVHSSEIEPASVLPLPVVTTYPQSIFSPMDELRPLPSAVPHFPSSSSASLSTFSNPTTLSSSLPTMHEHRKGGREKRSRAAHSSDDNENSDDSDNTPRTSSRTNRRLSAADQTTPPDSKMQLGSEDPLMQTDKQKLARKAELARISRRRKKLYIQDLEMKVKKLGSKIEELQQKAARERFRQGPLTLSDREEKVRRDHQRAIRDKLDLLLNSESLSEQSEKELKELVSLFVANSRERQGNIEFYLSHVEECLKPGLQVKFAMWGLDQNDDFYERPGLWTSLMCNQIGLNDAQIKCILSKRAAIHQERKNLATCELMLRETRAAILGHLRSLHGHMDDIQSVMLPAQLAKFYLWVENNEWCMQMLNSM